MHVAIRERLALIVGHRPLGWATMVVIIAVIYSMSADNVSASDDPPATDLSIPIEINARGTVEMHVADLPLSAVLQMLSLQGKRSIIATPNVSGTVTADLYNATFEEALDAILTLNGCAYRVRGGMIYVYTQEELRKLEAEKLPPETRVLTVYYLEPPEALSAIKPMLSESGMASASPSAVPGLTPDSSSAGGQSSAGRHYLIVTDHPAVLDHVERVLQEIDVRPQQVLIEATILRATLTNDNALGVDFTLTGGVDLELLGTTSAGITNLQTGALPQSRFENFNSIAQTDFNSQLPDGGIKLGIIKDHVGVFIQALEQVTDTVLLANPKILAMNKQKGQVIVGRRDGYITTTVTETSAIQTVEFLETGTQLIFRPYIGRDGYVRLELHPEDSIGGLTPANLPFETTTELTTNVQVKDGQTVLIGGLFREVTSNNRAQVPLLGTLPGIGEVFRSRRDSIQREEVIILLTVHIVKDQERFAEDSEKYLDQIERVRVGVRRGVMQQSRERLARMHFREALEASSVGERDAALWHLDMSLENDSRFISAIRLKEELLEHREWDDEGSVTRDLLLRMLLDRASPGLGRQRYGRPALPQNEPIDLLGPTGFHDAPDGTSP